MKGSEFVKLIRKAVREEVKSAIREELKSIKPLIAEAMKSSKQPLQKPTQPQRTTPIVSMDDMDFLSEGIDNNFGQDAYEDWPDMNNGPMTSDIFAADSDFGLNGFAPQQLPQQTPQVSRSVGSDPLLRDYSKVLKQADEIAQGYR